MHCLPLLIQRNKCVNNATTGKRQIFSTPEAKTVILLAFYVIFLSISIVFVGKGISNSRPFRENLFAYFICQSNGDDPACHIFQEEYYKYESSGLTSAVFIMIGLINWINLIFAIQIQDIKIIVSKVSSKIYRFYRTITFTRNSLSTSTTNTES